MAMREDVRRDLSWSAAAFVDVVWPHIAEWCDGGQLEPVESADAAGSLLVAFDTLAGIDAFQVIRARQLVRGIASRVQPDRNWQTFTIRYARATGGRTEWEKRCSTIADGGIAPHLTVQAYTDGDRRSGAPATCLRGVGVIRTRDLFDFARDRFDAWTRLLGRRPGAREMSPCGALEMKRVEDGNLMLCVRWSSLRTAGAKVRTWPLVARAA